MGPPGPSVANYVAMDGPPGPSTAAIDGPPDHLWRRKWSPIVTVGPLKLSLEMMSRGSYEVNLANMDRMIIIIIYFRYACIASCSSYRRPSSVDTHTAYIEVIQLIESISCNI